MLKVSCWKRVQITMGPEEAATNSIGQNFGGMGCLVRKDLVMAVT